MSVEELKKEINAKVEVLNEPQLKMVEQFIEKINTSEENEWDLKKYADEILKERTDVLQKLAQ